jgi:hypothetical protein
MTVPTPRVHEFLTLQSRGLLALPQAVRKRYHLDRPGAQVELTEREDGVLELRPHIPVPATQSWFWTTSWQTREHEVDAHVHAGRITAHEDTDAFLTHLDDLDDE